MFAFVVCATMNIKNTCILSKYVVCGIYPSMNAGSVNKFYSVNLVVMLYLALVVCRHVILLLSISDPLGGFGSTKKIVPSEHNVSYTFPQGSDRDLFKWPSPWHLCPLMFVNKIRGSNSSCFSGVMQIFLYSLVNLNALKKFARNKLLINKSQPTSGEPKLYVQPLFWEQSLRYQPLWLS